MSARRIIALVVGIALLGLAAAAAGLGTLPAWRSRQALWQRVEHLRKAVAERASLIEEGRGLLERVAAKEGGQARLEVLLPGTRDAANIIAILAELAASRGVLLEEINFLEETKTPPGAAGQPQAGEPFRAIAVALKASAPYQSLRSFLTALAQSGRLIDVRRMNVSSEGTADVLRFDAELVSYYRVKEMP